MYGKPHAHNAFYSVRSCRTVYTVANYSPGWTHSTHPTGSINQKTAGSYIEAIYEMVYSIFNIFPHVVAFMIDRRGTIRIRIQIYTHAYRHRGIDSAYGGRFCVGFALLGAPSTARPSWWLYNVQMTRASERTASDTQGRMMLRILHVLYVLYSPYDVSVCRRLTYARTGSVRKL